MKNDLMKRIFGTLSIGILSLLVGAGSSFAASTVTRSLSAATYTVGTPVIVTITATPDAAVLAYALQETPPAGWTISNVDNSGNSVGGVVKWGVYFDANPRTFTYQITPPVGTTGTKSFTGSASFDGASLTIGGTASITELIVPDTTLPTVSVTAPANNATVLATLSVTASASDNVGVVGVQFKLDGVNLGSEDTTAPYSVSWNTTQSANGSHMLTATARDAAGNSRVSTAINVTVNNPDVTLPTVALTAPAAGATVGGAAVTLSATASDNIGVTRVEFYSGVTKIGEDLTAPYSMTWDTTVSAANGGHSLTARAFDAAGNSATSAAVVVTVYNAVPNTAFRSLSAATYVPGTPVTVTINASPGASVLAYALQDTYPAGWTVSNITGGGSNVGGVIKWGVFFDATPRVFTYDVTAPAGSTGSRTFTGEISFDGVTVALGGTSSINGPAGDSTQPNVSITSPANNTTVSGTISVAGTASDNVGVVGVQFRLDGANLGAEDLNAPYTVSWNTTGASNGAHSLTAVARDAAGNTRTSAAISVTVSNTGGSDTTQPTVSITSPANTAVVSGIISISGTAADNVGVVGVRFQLDDVNIGSEDTSAPYSISWNTAQSIDGAHTLKAIARDAAGNTRTSTVINVIVGNNTPGGEAGSSIEAGFLPFKNVFVGSKDTSLTISYTLSGSGVGSSALKSSAISGPGFSAGSAALKIHDRLGNEVRTLSGGTNTGGNNYQSVWDGRNNDGELVASGTYILILNQNNKIVKRKIVVVR